MKFSATAALLVLLPALAACDQPKPRHAAPAPLPPGLAPQKAPPAPVATPLSQGLPSRPEFPGFYLDRIGPALDPLTRPATAPGNIALELSGFGYDVVAKAPAKGVDLDIDGRLYPTTYGSQRHDVAVARKNPALEHVGYATTLPAGTLQPGPHQVVVRVVTADGTAYYQSPAIKFTIQ